MSKLLIILFLVFGLFACLPTKKAGITLEGKTSTPRAYTEMIERNEANVE